MKMKWTPEQNLEFYTIVTSESTIGNGLIKASEAFNCQFYCCRSHWYSNGFKKFVDYLLSEPQQQLEQLEQLEDKPPAKSDQESIHIPHRERGISNTVNNEVATKNEEPLTSDQIKIVPEQPQQPSSSDIFKQSISLLNETFSSLSKENSEIKKTNAHLTRKLEALEKRYSDLESNYNGLMRIINNARKMAHEEEGGGLDVRINKKFKMDSNGNLESIS
jgi:predicted RNase H-like nuclease (RuvC/YqgF family)